MIPTNQRLKTNTHTFTIYLRLIHEVQFLMLYRLYKFYRQTSCYMSYFILTFCQCHNCIIFFLTLHFLNEQLKITLHFTNTLLLIQSNKWHIDAYANRQTYHL